MKISDSFDSSWYPIVNLLYQEPLKSLNEKILPEISFQPKKEDIFRIFSMPVTDIKVVILGQDPYSIPGNSIGRAFAVPEDIKEPVNLINIKKEIWNNDVNVSEYFDFYQYNTLQHLQDQGVFLLNSALTVETGKARSHLKYWKEFTQRVVSFIASENPCIWMLWGKEMQQYKLHINNPFDVKGYDRETINNIPSNSDWNYILQASYPISKEINSDVNKFSGCKHFEYTNKILEKTKSCEIIW